MPVRGIAMILLAVAVLLLAWGVYAMTNSSSDTAADSNKTKSEQQRSVAPAAPATAASSALGSGAATPAPATPATPGTATPGASAPSSAPASVPAPAPAPGAAQQGGAVVDASAVQVHALNNSTVQGLANRVADKLKAQGFTRVDSGNLPNEILPHSVAYYTPGNAAEEQAANSIAQNLKIKAQPRDDSVKDAPAGVVVVITEELNR